MTVGNAPRECLPGYYLPGKGDVRQPNTFERDGILCRYDKFLEGSEFPLLHPKNKVFQTTFVTTVCYFVDDLYVIMRWHCFRWS